MCEKRPEESDVRVYMDLTYQGMNWIGQNERCVLWPRGAPAKEMIQIEHIGQPPFQMRTLTSIRNQQIAKSRRIVTCFLHSNGGILDCLGRRTFHLTLPYLWLVIPGDAALVAAVVLL